ncbi:MAG: hypothetical protein ABIO83_11155 [Ilumatobacteraceae bacterium]
MPEFTPEQNAWRRRHADLMDEAIRHMIADRQFRLLERDEMMAALRAEGPRAVRVVESILSGDMRKAS